MKVLLVYNPKAGTQGHTGEQLAEKIRSLGHEVTLVPKHDELHLNGYDLIAIAGGDGTVEKVLRRVCDLSRPEKNDVPVAIIPLGTANNIAHSLGIMGDPEDIINRWGSGSASKRLTVGEARSEKYRRYFLESVGFGVLAQLIQQGDDQKCTRTHLCASAEEALRQRTGQLQEVLRESSAEHFTLLIDGQDYSGEYLLLEISNCPRVGPAVQLAPNADPSDDFLEVTLVAVNEKVQFDAFLKSTCSGRRPSNPFTRVKAKRVEVGSPSPAIHIDDKCLTVTNSYSVENWTIEAAVHKVGIYS